MTLRTHKRSGFTVVELVGVSLILGLISTVIYVSWQSMVPRSELNAAVRELAAAIHGVRSDAIARSARFDILYDFEGDAEHGPGYAIMTPFKPGGGMVSYTGNAEEDEVDIDQEDRVVFDWQVLPESVRIKRILVDGFEYHNGVLPIRFDPLGASSAHMIVLEQPQYSNTFTIEVLGLTGLIRFHDGDWSRESPDDGDF